jgi:small subunit ribosomal protein S9
MATQRYFYGTGKRKTSVARVRLYPGPGEVIVNGRPLAEYFGRETDRSMAVAPLAVADLQGRFSASVKVAGGGITGQAGAIRHGVTRALIVMDEALKPALRRVGFVTRDARVKERKKFGLKRARKAPQYTKR